MFDPLIIILFYVQHDVGQERMAHIYIDVSHPLLTHIVLDIKEDNDERVEHLKDRINTGDNDQVIGGSFVEPSDPDISFPILNLSRTISMGSLSSRVLHVYSIWQTRDSEEVCSSTNMKTRISDKRRIAKEFKPPDHLRRSVDVRPGDQFWNLADCYIYNQSKALLP